jgi:hypothetical protein
MALDQGREGRFIVMAKEASQERSIPRRLGAAAESIQRSPERSPDLALAHDFRLPGGLLLL